MTTPLASYQLTIPLLPCPPAHLSSNSPVPQYLLPRSPAYPVPAGPALMDPVSLQLGTSHLWSWLVRLLSKDPEWLNAKVKFFLPKMDLSSEDKAQDAAQGVILQLGRLHTQGRATWQAFIHCVCMELDVPLDLEVPLLSTWGHGDGKGRRDRHRAAG